MDKKVRIATRAALSAALLSGLFGLAGCSGESAAVPSQAEGAARPRDERQKANEYGGDISKAVAKPGGRR